MNTQGIQGTRISSSKLLILVLWHTVVACVVSFASLVPGVILIGMFGQFVGRALCFILVGFCGVISGALCMRPSVRGFGALGLTLLGVIFYSGFIAQWNGAITDEGKLIDTYNPSLATTLLLAFGGLLATVVAGRSSLAWLWRKRNDGIIRRIPVSNP